MNILRSIISGRVFGYLSRLFPIKIDKHIRVNSLSKFAIWTRSGCAMITVQGQSLPSLFVTRQLRFTLDYGGFAAFNPRIEVWVKREQMINKQK
jgi:hypothetical protein